MSRVNIAAYTPAVPNPPYMSINDEGDGHVSFTVRDERGKQCTIKIPADEWVRLAGDIGRYRGQDPLRHSR